MSIILDASGRPANGPLDQETCTHGVTFDEEASKGMSVNEVRARFPRLHGSCTLCGFSGIYYASYTHYLRGDW